MTKHFVYIPKCSFPGCADQAKVKGLCVPHYQKIKQAEYRSASGSECRTAGCFNTTERGIFCQDCKAKRTSRESRAKARRESLELFERTKSACQVLSCGAPIAAVSDRAKPHRLAMCVRHCADMQHKAMGLDSYLAMMAIERCESCGSAGPLVTDHDHACDQGHFGKNSMCPSCIRGRICSPCNTSLGSLGEDPERIRALADYAERIAK